MLLALVAPGLASAGEIWRFIFPEQRRMEIRDPSRLPKARLPDLPPPPTVSDPQREVPDWNLSLDDAIRTALANSEVVRVLAGVTATSSGSTIYDPAITNTGIDQTRAEFDPAIEVLQNNFSRERLPRADRVRIWGDPTQDYNMSMGLLKKTIGGGTARLDVNADASRTTTHRELELNPYTSSSLDLRFTQPLLQGGGRRANLAPIVLARIDTERSFFQLKDSAQGLVRGVIEAYWALRFARTDRGVRQQQVEQGERAFLLGRARLEAGTTDSAEVAQARSALANFRAGLITAEADQLQREAALRNILGLPPSEPVQIVPVTPLNTERLPVDWDSVVRLAEEYRPDLIELKLILEADEQNLLLAHNQALPRVDASALYRWNGLEGRTPDGDPISSGAGEFTGWQLGVNFSVPIGLRQSRAELRQQELITMRDRANLQQGLHNAVHLLAVSYRNLAQYHDQYQAFREAGVAAQVNLVLQRANYQADRTIYLNVLQAITNWGNAVSAEAQALAQYNVELANLEVQTGTILETHGIRFFEERYGSIGPLGRLFRDRCYPKDYRPGPNVDQYQRGSEPAEQVLGLDVPTHPRQERSQPKPASPSPNVDRLRIEIPERIPVPAPRR